MSTPTTKCTTAQEHSPFALFCINSLSPLSSQTDYWQSVLREPNPLRKPQPKRYCGCPANRRDCTNCMRVACVNPHSSENKVVLKIVTQKTFRTSLGDTPQPRKQSRPKE